MTIVTVHGGTPAQRRLLDVLGVEVDDDTRFSVDFGESAGHGCSYLDWSTGDHTGAILEAWQRGVAEGAIRTWLGRQEFLVLFASLARWVTHQKAIDDPDRLAEFLADRGLDELGVDPAADGTILQMDWHVFIDWTTRTDLGDIVLRVDVHGEHVEMDLTEAQMVDLTAALGCWLFGGAA